MSRFVSTTDDHVPPVTELLAAFAARLTWADLPQHVREKSVELVTDFVGNAIAGASHDSSRTIRNGLRVLGVFDGALRVPGTPDGHSPYAAAFATAAAAHTLDFDDTHGPSESHPGAPVIAAALAAAQVADATPQQLLTGIVAGYEVMVRLCYGLPSTAHADLGFHLTATTGIFGAAAAAANIFGLTQLETEHAFGTALSRVGGSGQFLETGAWTKRYHTGAAAADGLSAAVLARTGLTGATKAFEGRFGLFALYSPAAVPEAAVVGLGETWEILETSLKPYQCCRASHGAVDGIAEILRDTGARASGIARIDVGMARRCLEVVAVPEAAKRTPSNAVEGQFSVHFAIAATAIVGRLRYDEYERLVADGDVRDLMQRVSVHLDHDAEAVFPAQFATRIRVTFADGRAEERFVPVPSGDPARPLTTAELRDKFVDLSTDVLGRDGANDAFDHCQSLAERDDLGGLLAALAPEFASSTAALPGAS